MNNTTSNITAKTIQNEVSAITAAATINTTLLDNLAILVDIERKFDIIAEILANQGDYPTDNSKKSMNN